MFVCRVLRGIRPSQIPGPPHPVPPQQMCPNAEGMLKGSRIRVGEGKKNHDGHRRDTILHMFLPLESGNSLLLSSTEPWKKGKKNPLERFHEEKTFLFADFCRLSCSNASVIHRNDIIKQR